MINHKDWIKKVILDLTSSNIVFIHKLSYNLFEVSSDLCKKKEIWAMRFTRDEISKRDVNIILDKLKTHGWKVKE